MVLDQFNPRHAFQPFARAFVVQSGGHAVDSDLRSLGRDGTALSPKEFFGGLYQLVQRQQVFNSILQI